MSGKRCFCGHSEMMPWCDDSHLRLGVAPKDAEASPAEKPSAENSQAGDRPPRRGLFGWLRPAGRDKP
jgi:CDGSH-type Zn-finger protein